MISILQWIPMETSWSTDMLLFVFCFGFGAVVGLVAVIVALTMDNKGTAKFSPRERVVMSMIGFIIGGAANFMIVSFLMG